MATAGPNYPSSGASLANAGTSENSNAWTNPGNVGASSAVASITAATFDSPDIGEILVASGFGFSLTPGDIITGITVEVRKRGFTSANSGKDFRVQLATGTTFADLVGTNKATADVWPQNTLATTTYGGTSDTWSAGLTVAQINSTGFAVFVSAYANVANADIEVDWIRVTITYTPVQAITVPFANAGATLYAPTLVQDRFLVLPLLEQTANQLYDTFTETTGNIRASQHLPETGGPWVDDATNYPIVNSDQDYLNHQIATTTQYDVWAQVGQLSACSIEMNVQLSGAADFNELDIWARKTASGLVSPSGLVVRCVWNSSTTWQLQVISFTSGTPTTLDTAGSYALDVLTNIRVELAGANVKVYVDDNLDSEVTDSLYASETWFGLHGTGASVDQWDAAIFDLVITGGVAAPAVFAPALEGLPPSGPQTVTLGLLDAAAALYAPILTPGPVGLALPLLGPTYAAAVLNDTPIRYFQLGESSGTAMVDATGTANGSYVNTPTLGVAGGVLGGTAVSFEEDTQEYAVVKATGHLLAPLAGSSVETWFVVPANSSTRSLYVERANTLPTSLYKVEQQDGHIGITWQDDNATGYQTFLSTVRIDDGLWHHLAVTVDGTAIKIYLDGRDTYDGGTLNTSTKDFAQPGTECWLAADKYDGPGGYNWDSALQHVALYDYVLTPVQIATHYAAADPAVLYAPTLVQTAQNIVLPLLDGAPALYAPSLQPGPVGVTLGLIDAGPALYAPTLLPKSTLSIPLLDGAPALYAPAITPKWTVTLGLLDGAPATYAPGLTPKWAITLGLIDGAPALYAPALEPEEWPIILPLLDGAAATYAPSLAQTGGPTQAITLDLLDAGPDIFAPALAVGPATITLGLLDAGPATYAPEVQPDQFVVLGLIDGGPATYAPAILPQPLGLYLPLLDAGPDTYAPTLTVSAITLVLPLIDGGPATYAPAVVPAPLGIFAPLLDAAAALYPPQIMSTQAVVLGLLDAGRATYAPALLATTTLGPLGLIDSTPALYQPTLVAISRLGPLPTLDGVPALYPPTITSTYGIGLLLIDGSPALYPPVLAPGAVTIGLGLIDAGPAIFALSLYAGGERTRYRGRIADTAAVAAIAPAGRRGTLRSSEPVGDVE